MGARTRGPRQLFASAITVLLGVLAAVCMAVTYVVILGGSRDDVAPWFAISTIAVVVFLVRLSARSRTRHERRSGAAVLSTR